MSLTDLLWPDVATLLPEDALARIADHAADADRSGELATDSLAILRDAGFPGAAVPAQFGGAGASLLECCALQRRLGAADPALAVAVNMHLFSVGLMVEHWRRRSDTSWLVMEAIATQRRLLASAFAEPHLGGSVTRSTMRATRVPKGWAVSGVKRPCSLAAVADLVCLQVQAGDELLVALLPTTAPGLSVERTWNSLGMRASGSDTLRLDECVIPDELVFYRAPAGAEDDDVLAAGIVWFCLTSTSVYLGLAQAAIGSARSVTTRQRVAHLDAARAELPSVQALLGDHLARLFALEAACVAVAGRLDDDADPQELLPAALAVKQTAIDVVPELVGALAESCGGAAYGRSLPLERYWRDAQAICFHPPTRAATRQFLSRRSLGVPAFLDLDEDAPRSREQKGGSHD